MMHGTTNIKFITTILPKPTLLKTTRNQPTSHSLYCRDMSVDQ